jgi:hypothetical protein
MTERHRTQRGRRERRGGKDGNRKREEI